MRPQLIFVHKLRKAEVELIFDGRWTFFIFCDCVQIVSVNHHCLNAVVRHLIEHEIDVAPICCIVLQYQDRYGYKFITLLRLQPY